ncbi:cell division protein FtsQ/DivIB [Alkalicoccus halolimnae]|uniref:Cell division protein DivIB n=1 Tax=Alkalicoccus halolimnae TaxID=1667239 RepID=A0A5C7FD71_9BACI|nr:FtsQ-type POTRA domain-containing protein [Alkalicoccus halolimnae]TXF87428.1 FtsQ-type POTRA domain-containing protein [Alkalicoccus halolimnae]
MADKTVVDMQDKLPQLKEQRKQRSRRRFIVYVSIFLILIAVMVYLQSGFSNVKSIEVTGAETMGDSEVIALSELNHEVNIWSLNKEDRTERIESHDAVTDASISRGWFNKVIIHIEEYKVIASVSQNEGKPLPVLENGKLYDSAEVKIGSVPLLRDFEDAALIEETAMELGKMSESLRGRISEVIYNPDESNPDRVTVLMNDGWTVSSTIRAFAERMEPYPTIVQQLEPDQEGIIHMRLNPYFESFREEEDITVE